MEKIKTDDFPARKTMSQQQSILTSEQDDWYGIAYRPNPNCSVCKGAGFVHPRDGDRIIYWKVVPCLATGCLLDSIRGKQPSEVQKQTFETFRTVPGTEKAMKAAWALAYGEAEFIWLLIYGQPGNGKTHLCNAMVKVVRGRGWVVRMVMAADLFSMLREAIESKKADVLLRQFKDIFFLVIDDYGVEYGSDWESAKFDELMTSRYATGKPTVLITNKKLADLPERIRSRFQDKVMARAVHNSAADYRSRKS